MAGLRKTRKSQTKSESPIPTTEATDANVEENKPQVGEGADSAEAVESTLPEKEYDAMQTLLEAMYQAKDEEGEDISHPFHRMINKRSLPQYYQVIKRPVAMSSIKGKISKRSYQDFSEFVEDFAYICHNAQLYNRPEAPVYGYALQFRAILIKELEKLVQAGSITKEQAALPDLGEIPPPSPQAAEEDEEEDEEDDEEDEEQDDSEEEVGRKRKRRGTRSAGAGAKRDPGLKAEEGTGKGEVDPRKRRGRPPRVDTPMEARVKAILKGLRKFKGADGQLKCSHFERLPDKAAMPEYFEEIKNPIALDTIKKKSKRKKYQSVDHFMKDVETMFDNAKSYNIEASQIYKDADELQQEARILAEQEKKKPDTDFLMDDGRVPLPGILHNGELFKVGDWVHIKNPNDLTKPIVTQIYRTWQDVEGQKWVNACWYYRPEQTVHRAEKHFYEHEVVKTGQYRDHRIDEVIDKCFVMFFTRFNKGRPRGFPLDKEVYVCESRYNEEKHKLNKIKTWASCLPDEVRDKDYEMDLFDQPRKMKKVPSPIAHLLPEDAKSDDDVPEPTWASDAAPPVIGAVHKRHREANESPPPEPTPPPPPTPPRAPTPVMRTQQAKYSPSPDSPVQQTPLHSSAPNIPQNHTQYQPHYGSHNYASRASMSHPQSAGGLFQSNAGYNLGSTFRTPMANTSPAVGYQPHGSAMASTGQGYPGNAYNPPPEPLAFVLDESVNASIPKEVRDSFHQDDSGRVLFFAAGSNGKPAAAEENSQRRESSGGATLNGGSTSTLTERPATRVKITHSPKYLAAMAARAPLVEAHQKAQKEKREKDERERKAASLDNEAKRKADEQYLLQDALLGFVEAQQQRTRQLNRQLQLE